MIRLLLGCSLAALFAPAVFAEDAPATVTPHEEAFLSNARQVSFGLPRAGEGYFSKDGEWIVYQAYPVGYPFYQIYVQRVDERVPQRISTGRGRTTCAYFTPDGETIMFASSHTDPDIEATELKARELAAAGGRRRYEWDFDPHMEIYTVKFDGTGLKRLTDSPGYDAEGSYSSDGSQIVFTSNRDGDPDIFIMNADGSNVRQVVNQPGYDGGPFFSPNDKWIIFRSDREEKDMLQIRAVSVDGKQDIRLTDNLQQVNWCPFFHPSGKYIIWSGADYSMGPRSANFDLWVMEIEMTDTTFKGGKTTRITDHASADVLPVFSPDGTKLMWTATQRNGDPAAQLWIADWKFE